MTTTVEHDSRNGDAADARLGASIRRLRHTRGLTLVTLAEATELSHPFLSQLERGLAQPSLSSLRRIAIALETSPIELIADADAAGSADPVVEVHRRGEGSIDEGFAAGSARMLASGARPLHPLEVTGGAGEPGECFVHAEDEFLYVVEGAITVELDGEERALTAGDSAYYAGGVRHRWWSSWSGTYRLLVVKQGLRGAGTAR
ncbi:XRE family transcriptional regulator [Microbacterium sp. LRZ72]|uniref:helix-turn-helix domain-containing protein n=1 Tax=Microbacterium sp. LRZ72 TaxID=2942481 RepID=UPI0029A8A73F|nr:XRE family transcriptional regulator [Microbacterium sp. LRZ72]MDX2376311.1 XRE family transcriptional regulator [Microbacterium sp. LRZ72]